MKIGILTIPFNNNYGGYLQSFALMTVIKELGHDVVLINRRPECDTSFFKYVKGFIKYNIIGNKSRVYNRKTQEIYYRQKGAKMIPFVDKYITPKTQKIYKIKDYSDLWKYKFDVVIVGSDQVWRPKYVPTINEYFLEYIPSGVKKIAYAASFGTEKLEYNVEDLNHCKDLIRSFVAVSVREKSGKDLLEKYFDYENVDVVLDPTMLLSKDYYLRVVCDESVSVPTGVFSYILDRNEDKERIVVHLSELYEKPIYDIMHISKYAPYSSIEEWLNGINKADLVVTDSFHGAVFSILFNKQFYVINNFKRGNSRITDLLSMFNLNNRLISDINDIRHIDEPINWDFVNTKLLQQRNKSLNFLKEALS